VSAPATLGRLLAREAERLKRRHSVTVASVRGAGYLADRLAHSRLTGGERFRRIEPTAAGWAAPDSGDAPTAQDWTGIALPARTRARLRDLLGADVERIRVHDGPAADRVAAGARADALAVGTHVAFRAGRYRPDDRSGFGLIAHEAAHAAESLRPGAAVRRSTLAGVQREEAHARAVARAALAPVVPPRADAPSLTSPEPAVATAERPLRAAGDYAAAADDADHVPGVDLQQLRQMVLGDLLAQIRCEAERGG
jgi:hypothetical protein